MISNKQVALFCSCILSFYVKSKTWNYLAEDMLIWLEKETKQ